MEGFAVAFLLTGLTGFIQIGLNFLTGAWPERPTGVAYAAALAIGVAGAFLFAVANSIVLTDQNTAQLVIVGVFAAAGAAGLNYQTVKAEQKRAAGEARGLIEDYRGPERRSKI